MYFFEYSNINDILLFSGCRVTLSKRMLLEKGLSEESNENTSCPHVSLIFWNRFVFNIFQYVFHKKWTDKLESLHYKLLIILCKKSQLILPKKYSSSKQSKYNQKKSRISKSKKIARHNLHTISKVFLVHVHQTYHGLKNYKIEIFIKISDKNNKIYNL